MSLFQRKLTCFYCGQPTSSRWKRGLQHFQCDHCDSVNYLDEKGEIADPPAPPTPKQISRYVSPTPDTSFYAPKLENEEIFCRTCLQNQHVVAQALASHDREDTLAERKAHLEKQYPPCCRDCKPRVDKKLAEANYLAKSDYIRRQNIRTRQGKSQLALQRTWRDGVLLIAGVLWSTSLCIEIVWHLLGLIPISSTQYDLKSHSPVVLLACSLHAVFTTKLQSECLAGFSSLEKIGLLFGLGSIWWHPKLSDKLHSPFIQLIGYHDYFSLQGLALALRTVFWWNLRGEYRDYIWGRVPVRALHGAALIFMIVSPIVGLTRVNVKRHTVDFTKGSASTVDIGKDQQGSVMTPKADIFKSETHITSTFPISKLASPYETRDMDLDPASAYTTASETDADDGNSTATEDQMDWTPIQQPRPFPPPRPVPATNQIPRYSLRSTDPSPFRGTLPPAPEPPLHKALKPRAPVFKATSEQRKENFFAQVMGRDHGNNAADFGGALARRKDYELSDGKLRLPEGKDSTTGLENLFSSSFQLDDGPAARKKQIQKQEKDGMVRNDMPPPTDLSFAFWVIGVVALVGCILGVANVILPGFYGSIARGLASVWRS